MEYIQDLLNRYDDVRVALSFSKLEKIYQADLQRRATRDRWMHVIMGIGESIESALGNLQEMIAKAGEANLLATETTKRRSRPAHQ